MNGAAAGGATDRGIALRVQPVDRDVVRVDVGHHVLVRPVGERDVVYRNDVHVPHQHHGFESRIRTLDVKQQTVIVDDRQLGPLVY